MQGRREQRKGGPNASSTAAERRIAQFDAWMPSRTEHRAGNGRNWRGELRPAKRRFEEACFAVHDSKNGTGTRSKRLQIEIRHSCCASARWLTL